MKVTVITPTTHSRHAFNERLALMIAVQDYPDFEHIWDYSEGLTIGAKRNALCMHAKGDIIIHADSDDLYAPDWISRSVGALLMSEAAITGLSSGYFYQPNEAVYIWQQKPNAQLFLLGATLCYWRQTWQRQGFQNISQGEDMHFISNNGKLYAHNYINGFVATIHGANTCCHKSLVCEEMKRLPDSNIDVINERWFKPAR